jgi:hypothetical protein
MKTFSARFHAALTAPPQPDEAFVTLLETLKDQADYGAYESVFQALLRFAPARRGRLIAQGVLPLLRRAPELAGDVLSQQLTLLCLEGAAALRDADGAVWSGSS